MRPSSLTHAMQCIKLFIGKWDNTCRSAPFPCPCTVEQFYSRLENNKIQLVLLTYFSSSLLFLLDILFQVLWFVLFCTLTHPLYPPHSWQSFSCLLLFPPHPHSLPFFTPRSALFLELPFIPLLNICIHFPNRIRKTMTYSSGPGQQNDLYLLLSLLSQSLSFISFLFTLHL